MPDTPEIEIHHQSRPIGEIQRRYGLGVLGGGEWTSAPDGFYRTPARKFEFYSLSHMFAGRGRLWLADGNREWDMRPGDGVLIAPGAVNRYGGSDGQSYSEDTILFCGPVADMLAAAGVIRTGWLRIGAERRLRTVTQLAADPAAEAQIQANLALQTLLVELWSENRRPAENDPVEPLLERLRRHPERWWTVAEMAEFCHLSIAQFRRVFHRRTGALPKNYVEELKLRRAAELLLNGTLPIPEVGEKLGYADPYHFARRFKICFGVSPGRYRKQLRLQ